LIRTGVSGMDFASYETLVDAMSGHPLVVTMGVREQMVKPATKCAGSIAMSSAAISFTPQRFVRLRQFACALVFIALLAADSFVFQSRAADAGSTTAQFRVSARVVRSCHVSPKTMIEQRGVTANVPVNVKCDNNDPSRNSALEPVRATVSYTWVEGSEDSNGTKLVTLHF
jgi:hypothetical protein